MIENLKSLDGIKAILLKFKDHDLFALAGTVTQGFLKDKLESRAEAIEAIIKYSPDEESFLKRKVITRDNLFQHLHENGVDVKLPVTKDKLIDKVLEFWFDNDQQIVLPEIDQQENTRIRLPINENNQSEELVSTNSQNGLSTAVQDDVNSVQIHRSEVDIMAEKFTEWFYSMMNQNECMGIEHFFPDSKLILKLINAGEESLEEVENNTGDLVQLLFNTKQRFNLFFNPNITKDGVRGKMDRHGLVMIVACGTLHINNIVSGVFEQIFALARDPLSDNNWKIKNTQLVLRSKSDVNSVPQLCDTELPHILEVTES